MSDTLNILVINCGSSSIKFKIFALPAVQPLIEGNISGIAEQHGENRLIIHPTASEQQKTCYYPDHQQAFTAVIADLNAALQQLDLTLNGIGHRVVYGGERFIAPTVLTPSVVHQLKQMSHLAPQHLPANTLGIQIAMQLFADLPQIAVFDTAFHHHMPEYAYRYAIPDKWFKQFGIRRYGFHGSSHHYVARQAAELLDQSMETLNLISLHLGNGASACAIKQGKSIDTSMGFTPLAGLMMGTRSGDLDAAIPLYLQQHCKISADEIEKVLNFNSGLQAICGSHDMQDIIVQAQQGQPEASLALEMFVYRVRQYLGAYLLTLEHVDAVIFTGGIGENAPFVRACCCNNLERFGIELDEQRNNTQRRLISSVNSEIKILRIETNEELYIADLVQQLLI